MTQSLPKMKRSILTAIAVLFVAGVLLRVFYMTVTPPYVRGHDVHGHIDYIQHIVRNGSLPAAYKCWECFQPPLYYLVAAPVCSAFSCERNGDGLIYLQVLSLAFSIGFLFFSIKTLRLLLHGLKDRYLILAAALVIFWPAGIVNSVGINNDQLAYFLIAAGSYYIVRWYGSGRASHMWVSLGFAIVSIATKLSGLTLLGVIGMAVLTRYLSTRDHREFLRSVMRVFLVCAVIAAGLWARSGFDAGATVRKAVNPYAYGMGPTLLVGNGPANFLAFDAVTFLDVPFSEPWHDRAGRQYLSNFALKTSMFGEYSYESGFLESIAIEMSYVVLLMLLIAAIGTVLIAREALERIWAGQRALPSYSIAPPSMLLFVAALVIYRYLFPYAPVGDFRFIYPIVVPMAAAAAYALYAADRRRASSDGSLFALSARLGEGAVYAFLLLSVVFFVGLICGL